MRNSYIHLEGVVYISIFLLGGFCVIEEYGVETSGNVQDEGDLDTTSGKTNSKLKKAILLTMIPVTVLIILAIYTISTMPFNQLEYVVKRNAEDIRRLDVEVSVKNLRGIENDELLFYKVNVDAAISNCYDEKNRAVNFVEEGKYITIDVSGKKDIKFNYSLDIGNLGKHGHQGQSYDDMLVFLGGQVFMLPHEAYYDVIPEYYGKAKAIKHLSIYIEVPKDWTPICAIGNTTKRVKNSHFITIDSPSWREYLSIMKGPFAFGNFDKHLLASDGKGLTVYVDQQARQYFTEEAKQGLNAIYNYYKSLFNKEANKEEQEVSFVILRTDPNDEKYIMGGLGAQAFASTFIPTNARDWQLFAHRLGHIFFDSQVTSSKYEGVPQNWYCDGVEHEQYWFYEGIITYYENIAMDSLPESLKIKTGLDSAKGLQSLYRFYLYTRLKYPELYSIAPLKEKEITGQYAMIEFLHYTQAPLIIKAIEDLGQNQYGSNGVLLDYILRNPLGEGLTINKIIEYVIVDKAEEFTSSYLHEGDVLELWHIAEPDEKDTDLVINEINKYEKIIDSWMYIEQLSKYGSEALTSEGLVELSEEADRQNLAFASQDTEQAVKRFSPTVYKLLKQYALRAKVCGVELGRPDTRIKLLGDESNISKWEEYKHNFLEHIQ